MTPPFNFRKIFRKFDVRKSHFAAARPDDAPDAGFFSGIKPSPPMGCGSDFKSNPLSRLGAPPLGMNDSFTWWPGCPQKCGVGNYPESRQFNYPTLGLFPTTGGPPRNCRHSGSSRATKPNLLILWREVSTSGADLCHHLGDAETATPYYETFVVSSPPAPLPSQVMRETYHLGLPQLSATKMAIRNV